MINWNGTGIRINGRQVFSTSGPRGLHVARNNGQTESDGYERSVVRILDDINRRAAGNILLDEIRRALHANTRQIDIRPFDSSNNAASGGNRVQMTPNGEIVRDERGNPRLHAGDDPATPSVEQRGEPVRGTGAGISPMVLFDPRTFSPHLSATSGFAADEVLFHELNHSKRQVQARNRRLPIGANYDNTEEFAAIVVTNIYSSEGGATWLRGSHRMSRPGLITAPGTFLDHDASQIFGGMGVTPQQPTQGQRFAQQFRRELNELARNDAQFCRRLAGVRAHFNPIREHFLNIGAIARS